jgi:hypothetical protein
MWEYATERKKKKKENGPAWCAAQASQTPLSVFLGQLLRLSKKITVTSVSLSRGLKEFCQPTPGVGPQFFLFLKRKKKEN